MKPHLLVIVVLALTSCVREEPVPRAAPPQTDSLVKLMRKSLHERDPVPTTVAIGCQIALILKRNGEREGVRLVEEAERIAYPTARDRRAAERRDDRIANHTFPVGERACTANPDHARPLRRTR